LHICLGYLDNQLNVAAYMSKLNGVVEKVD